MGFAFDLIARGGGGGHACESSKSCLSLTRHSISSSLTWEPHRIAQLSPAHRTANAAEDVSLAAIHGSTVRVNGSIASINGGRPAASSGAAAAVPSECPRPAGPCAVSVPGVAQEGRQKAEHTSSPSSSAP
eukprot:2721203-Rhodomonas_salina.1